MTQQFLSKTELYLLDATDPHPPPHTAPHSAPAEVLSWGEECEEIRTLLHTPCHCSPRESGDPVCLKGLLERRSPSTLSFFSAPQSDRRLQRTNQRNQCPTCHVLWEACVCLSVYFSCEWKLHIF